MLSALAAPQPTAARTLLRRGRLVERCHATAR